MFLKIIFIGTFINFIFAQIQPPIWPNTFQQAFEQEFNLDTGSFKTSGILFYDAIHLRSRYDRVSGLNDPFCQSLLPNQTTDCTNLVVDGRRYIWFPKSSQCCFCCDSQHGCGILKPNWLQGASFEGEQSIDGLNVYRWQKPGANGPTRYYAATNNNRIPIRINENNAHIINFIPQSYKQTNFDDSTFELPKYCNNDCPITTICGFLRQDTNKKQLMGQ